MKIFMPYFIENLVQVIVNLQNYRIFAPVKRGPVA